ncbi:EpsG family protein [Enterococcus durans]|uniref:EpsG family protein n=1 Tax=Enterococcus durans TaxID=53345 RepID=UPI001EE124A5|nr:EpsG family protein [Enterococcus durans]MCG3447927.1 EpsG family protein [Enterococcus durans]
MALYIYIGTFTLLASLSVLEYLTRKKIFFYSGILFLTCLSGFRFFTGYDFTSYNNFFNQLVNWNKIFDGSIDAEPGYLFLNYIIRELGMNFSSFVLLFSIISLFLLAYALNSNFPIPSIALLYYYSRFFLVRDMGQIRSSIVAIILLLTLPEFKKNNLKKIVLFSLIGCLFHIVAIFIIPAYLFTKIIKDINVFKEILLISISTLIGVIFFFPNLFKFMIPDRYFGYLSGYYAQGDWIFNPVFIMQFGILIFATLFVTGQNKNFIKIYNVLLSLYCLSTILLVCFGPLATIGGRISTIFSTVEIFIVPIVLETIIKNKYLFLIVFIVFSFVIFVLIFIISGAYNSYIPYKTIFN